MNYDFIKRKNIYEYNTIHEYKIISENSSINSKVSDNNSDDITFKNDISDNNSEKHNKIKELIDKKFIDFRKKIIDKKNDIYWPIKVKFGGKSYFPMTKINYLINKNCKIIRYYCVNHNLNTKNKKFIFKKSPCNGQIDFDHIKEEFYFT